MSRHASTALWNAQEHHKIFLKPVLKAMGSPWRMFRGRTLAKIAAVLAVVLVVDRRHGVCPLHPDNRGAWPLLPEERQKVYAPVAGIVVEVLVDHDARVKKGDILAKLDSYELQKELKGLIAEKQKAESQIDLARNAGSEMQSSQDDQEAIQIQAQLAEAKITAKSSKERIDISNEQIESMNIRSPQDGIITTWEAKKNLLGRPVEIGTELLQIAATDGDWILEVEVPDDDMGPILAAQSKLEKDIKDGRKKAGTTAAGVLRDHDRPRAPLRGLCRPDRPKRRDDGRVRAVQEPLCGQGDDRLHRSGPQRLPDPQRDRRDAAGRRGPRPGRLRQNQPGLLLAPQADPGLLRIGPVPLAVLALKQIGG